MSEEEIIERANHFVNIHVLYGKTYAMTTDDLTEYQQVFKGLLDLYQQEKEKREEREKRLQEEINEVCKLKTELYGNSISKCKIESKIDILKKALEELEGISECATKYDTTQKLWHQIEILEQILEEE